MTIYENKYRATNKKKVPYLWNNTINIEGTERIHEINALYLEVVNVRRSAELIKSEPIN